MSKVLISVDDLTDGAIAELLNQHLEDMRNYSPTDSMHALKPDQLLNPNITFWGARIDGQLAGCGALKELTPETGEIKSMKTNPAFIRQGVAQDLLVHIIDEATSRSYTSLFLETGAHEAFDPAAALYMKYGFVECGPFGDYQLDPFSRFYSKSLI